MDNNIIKKFVKTRGKNKLYYNYKLKKDSSDDFEYFKSCNEITAKYGISRSNIYLMIKYPETQRRKYNNIKIEKIHKHYLCIDANVPDDQILF